MLFRTNMTGFTPNLVLKPDEQERCRNLHICTRAGGRSRLNRDLKNGPHGLLSVRKLGPVSRSFKTVKELRSHSTFSSEWAT